jgi:hypothetical protein
MSAETAENIAEIREGFSAKGVVVRPDAGRYKMIVLWR